MEDGISQDIGTDRSQLMTIGVLDCTGRVIQDIEERKALLLRQVIFNNIMNKGLTIIIFQAHSYSFLKTEV